MSGLSHFSDPDLLCGIGEDAGVYRLREDLAIVQSVDFFPPIVDDPYDFGAIAAANALSDIYTMGARPITALNLLAFPRKLGTDTITQIMRGGAEKVAEAGAVIIGGHSVNDDEPKYGLAVTGAVRPDEMLTSGGAQPGDALVLTKKIGVGIICSIAKSRGGAFGELAARGPAISEEVYDSAVTAMKRLNKNSAEAMIRAGVNACTDVTGFGLLGHARTMAENSGVKLVISYSATPRYDGIERYAIAGTKGGGERNYEWIRQLLELGPGVSKEQTMIMCDPQTSGGLLISIPAGKAERLTDMLRAKGEIAEVIGRVEDGRPGFTGLVA